MATVKYVLTLDDKLSKGLKSTRENVQKTIAALHALNDAANGVASGMQTAGGSVAMSADQVRDASVAIREASKAAGLGAEQQAKLAEASKKAAEAATAQREATRKARAEAKAAAAAARAEAKERAGLARVLDQQRAADERVRLGKEQAQAVQELRIIDQTIAKLRERNELTEEELALLERRKAQVRENLAIESGRAAQLGTRIDRGFGARGTRRSPIAGGVLSTHVKNLTKDMKALNSAAKNTARQLPDVFAQLATGTPIMQVFTQQGLQVAQSVEAETSAITGFLARLRPLAPALGAIAVVAGTLAVMFAGMRASMNDAGTASNVLGRRIRDASARLDTYAERLVTVTARLQDMRKASRDLKREFQVKTGAITEQNSEFQAYQEQLRASNHEARRNAQLVKSQAEAALEASAGDAALAKSRQELGRATAEDAALLRKRAEQQEKAANAAKALAAIDEEEIRLLEAKAALLELDLGDPADEPTGAGRGARAKQVDETTAQVEKQARALMQLQNIARQAETSQLDGIEAVDAALKDQLDTIDAIIKAQGRLTPQQQAAAARARGAVRGQAEAQRVEIRAKEQEEANKAAADAAIAAQEAAESLGDLLDSLGADIRRDGLGSLLTGDVAGAIEAGLGRAIALAGRGATAAGLEGLGAGAALAAGPLAAGTVALKEVGELGAAGVEDLAEATVEAIVAGIEALPEILVRVAPKIGVAIVTELIPALALLPIEFARAIGQALRELFAGGRERRQDRRERRSDRRAARRAERGFRSGTSMVERDGLHFLHRGEAVVPTSGATTQPVLERVREQAGVAPAGPRVRPVTMEALILRVGQASTPYATFPGTPP